MALNKIRVAEGEELAKRGFCFACLYFWVTKSPNQRLTCPRCHNNHAWRADSAVFQRTELIQCYNLKCRALWFYKGMKKNGDDKVHCPRCGNKFAIHYGRDSVSNGIGGIEDHRRKFAYQIEYQFKDEMSSRMKETFGIKF